MAGKSVISVVETPKPNPIKGCSFASPTSPQDLEKLSRKQFAGDTEKKICWVLNMYAEWQKYRNQVPNFDPVD